MRLAGRVVPITGARSGIGLATARLFAAEGASVVLANIKDASAEADALGSRCMAVAMDVAKAPRADEASYITGSIVAVDGGWTVQ